MRPVSSETTMAMASLSWEIPIADGQDAACGLNTLSRNDHRAVVQRRILKENVLYQSLVDARVNLIARIHDVIQGSGTLNDD